MNSPSPLAGEGKASRSDARERGRLLRGRAKAMRSAPTEAEHRLWQFVRAHRFYGFKFKRQVPIDHYIVDFLCPTRRLIVELDGSQHAESARDERRDAYLRAQGFHIVRIWNNELFTNEEGVAVAIFNALQSPLPARLQRAVPPPLKGGGADWSDHA